jgi:alginate O-acetyltransferase complex protein AlgJ
MTERLSKLLMLVALFALWLPALSLGWNSISARKWRSKPLVGVQLTPAPASLAFKHLIDGSFQRSLGRFIGPSIPYYADAVRMHNQVFYETLRLPTPRNILVGKDGYLHHSAYIQAYCHRDIERSTQEFRTWARMLREIQDKIESRGQTFIYVLTPSKIEHIPETLPAGYPCPSKDRQQFLATAVTHLRNQGVKHVDATAGVNETGRKYGYDPFPTGGIHWTDLSAYPALLEIIHAINTSKGARVIEPYEIAVSKAQRPTSTDQDFATLLNLLWVPKAHSTAQISVATPAPARCPEPISIVAVGGSFFTSLGAGLSKAPCPPKVSQLAYFVVNTLHFKQGQLSFDQQPDYDLLKSPDVVLVEENAGILLKTQHVPALHNYLNTGELPKRALY